jgi:hypothetical protein
MATKEPAKIVAFWLNELKASKKREERYRKNGAKVLALYEADQEQDTPFNILYSNTETLRPALYSAQPRPVVERRFKDDDPIGKLASEASKRLLEYHLDTNKEDYETLNEAMGAIVLDTLLPGRGVLALKYDANFVPIEEPRPPDDRDDEPVDESARAEYAEHEQVCYESIVWDRFLIGYAKKWTKVPWIAYQFHLTKEEVATVLGTEIATKLTYQSVQDTDEDADRQRSHRNADDLGERRTACIYQIWDKAGGKKVRYISPNYKDGELKVEDDPLGLTGFFNTPRPLVFVEKSCSLVPTAPYQMYKSQADELNRITRRMKKLIEACKARGIYDGAMGGDLETLMEKDDNALIPAQVSAALATEKGFQNAIWFLPIDVVSQVYQQLIQAREACKQTIYEITGIADIMRGATNASETLGAQQIKNQWGTLRLKRMQNEVARYVRDLERMTLDIASTKFSEETWAAMTGLPFVTSAQRQRLEQQAAILTQMQQPLPPDLQQQLAQPVWGQILQLLRDDLQRSYRIDIETNSTIEPEAAEDKQALTELLTALSQTMQAFGPLVLQGVLPFEAAQSMLLFIARRFRFGSEIEGKLMAMQPPKPQDDGQAKEMEAAHKQLEMDKQLAVKEVEYKKKESAMALKEQGMQQEMDGHKRDLDLQMREMQLQVKEQQFGMQQNVERGVLDLQKQHAGQELESRKQLQSMKEKKYHVEAVVNKKTDTAMSQGIATMKGLVEQLAAMVAQQSQDHQRMMTEMMTALNRPRVKKAIRGQDGRIEAVEEQVA